MKRCLVSCVTILCAFNLLADDAAAPAATEAPKQETSKPEVSKKIGAAEADKHIGETLVVTGKVAQVSIREKLVYVNLDKAYPNSPFTAVIFSRATNQFSDLPALKGKDVEVSGKIEEFHDSPQIVLNSTNQLKVIEKAEPAKE